jgi:hypothetical protein
MLQRFNSMGLETNNSNNMENPPLPAVSDNQTFKLQTRGVHEHD